MSATQEVVPFVRGSLNARLVSLLVGLHGVFILSSLLIEQFEEHHLPHLSGLVIDVPIVLGVGLIYLSTLLARRKSTAWGVTLLAYMFLLGFNVMNVLEQLALHHDIGLEALRTIALPAVVVGLLLLARQEFKVRSDTAAFKSAMRFVAIILAVTLMYGTGGFMLMDKHDFHEEIGFWQAAHRTIDQFDITTTHSLHPYTRRAHAFLDSLSVVSTTAFVYAIISLFQPLRARLSTQHRDYEAIEGLLTRYQASSEEFFKLWPRDKQFFFNTEQTAALAYHVRRGVALCLSDPVGEPLAYASLLRSFEEYCYVNDWLPAFIHISEEHHSLYETFGYSLQPIGQEASVNLHHFNTEVARNKYFRNIRNRFEKQGYTSELLEPPHHPAVIDRLRAISDEWLNKPGRTERGFVMGYFTEAYMQHCAIMVARDAAHTIQAFVNKIPADFDKLEANYDMLRYTQDALSNINDFLLVQFMTRLEADGYERLSMGLSPLVGLTEDKASDALINRVLSFAYTNGDRLYSFSGLRRFKDKYEPEWSDRYIAYRGGVRGFTRTMNALLWVMRIKPH